MITKLVRAYASEGKIRVGFSTMLRNDEAKMGLELIGDTAEWLTVKQAETLITELKNAVYDHYEGSN